MRALVCERREEPLSEAEKEKGEKASAGKLSSEDFLIFVHSSNSFRLRLNFSPRLLSFSLLLILASPPETNDIKSTAIEREAERRSERASERERTREEEQRRLQFPVSFKNGRPPAPRQDRRRHGPPLPRARPHGEGCGRARRHRASPRRRPQPRSPSRRLRRRLGQHCSLRCLRRAVAADACARGEAELAESVPGGEEAGAKREIGFGERREEREGREKSFFSTTD